MSVLGLDLGEKRIGVARSDELLLMAHASGLIERRSDAHAVHEIKRLIDEFRIQKVVVGLPKTLKGMEGTQANRVQAFVRYLEKEINCPVVTWEELLSTAEAEWARIAQDMSRAKRRKKRDAAAAEIILQSYLDFIKQEGLKGNV
jgi:putative holliday junction resolvase